MSDLNEEAKEYLEKYKDGGELNKPWAFSKALNQSQLDGSLESLDRVDRLLVQIHQRYKPDDAFLQRTDVIAFLRLLAYYTGQCIADRSGHRINWHSYESASRNMPSTHPIPRAFFSSLVGFLGPGLCIPLGPLREILMAGHTETSMRTYAEGLIVQYTPPPLMAEHERCQVYLSTFTTGKVPYGGLLFANELMEIKQDFSIRSLEELDQLLSTIRENDPPDFQRVTGMSGYANFLLWCSYYIAACIARLARVQMKWLSYDEAKALDTGLDQIFVTHHVCLLDGRMYFPLVPICMNLFQDPKDRQDIAAYAQQIVSSFPTSLRQVALPSELKTKDDCKSDFILNACFEAGNFAAHAISIESMDGRDISPRLLQAATPSLISYVLDFSLFESAQAAFSQVEDTLQHNPEKRPFLVFAFDSYANLITGRKDALTVQIRLFPHSVAAQNAKALELIFMMPYRKPNTQQAYVVFAPILQKCDLPAGLKTEEAINAFMSGLLSFKSPEFSWQQFFSPDALLE